jgi:CheY-like chemotaxis protein
LAERLTTALREEVAKAGFRSTTSDAPSFEVHPATGIIQEEEVEEAEFRSALDRLGPLPTVLIVEDDPSTRDYLRAALETEGYEVLEAPYQVGVEAMALVPSPVKAVLLDGNVPFADGQTPISTLPLALRLRAAGIPVIIHSGDDEINEEAREHGLRVMPKGSSLSDLLRAIQSCVEGAPEG